MANPETEGADPVVLADRAWIEVQQDTFTNWCNDRLKGTGVAVQNLVTDLDDGVKLIVLLKRISLKDVCKKYYEKPRLPVHRSENLEKAFRFMTEEEKLQLINIGPQDIIQHNQKIILGLIWHLILRYQIFGGQTTTKHEEEGVKKPRQKPPAKKILLNWLQSQMPPSLPVTGFSSDWNDGKHLSALVDSMKPGLIPDYASQVPSDALRNTQNAMDVAEGEFGIPKVIKPEHLCVEKPDELSVMTYLSYFCSGSDSPGHSSLLAWVREKIPEYNIQNFTTDWSDGRALSALVNAIADGSIPHHADLDPEQGPENVRNAMKTAEENLDGISTAVTPDNFAMDSLTMMGYIGSFRKATLKEDTTTDPGATAEVFTTKVVVQTKSPRSPTPVQEVKHTSVEETAQPVWPEDMAQTMQKPSNEDTDTVPPWGEAEEKPEADARQQAIEKAAELHKKFQEIVRWEAGKDFDKEEKRKIVEDADAEYKSFQNDPVTMFSVPAELTEQRGEAIKHWHNLCSIMDAEEQAEQTLQELRDLNGWVKDCLGDLDAQPPLADSLEGVRKQKEWHKTFMSKFNAKSPEIQKHASLSVTTYNEDMLDVIKAEHALLGKGRGQLLKKWQEWGKLLDACIAAWDKCISTEDKLRKLEEQHVKWGPPAENQDILEQFDALKTFQTSRVVPFKSEVSAMTDPMAQLESLGGHPPVDGLYRSVKERYDWLVSTVDKKCTATQECCQMAREFEQVKLPFEAWVTKAESDVNGLLQQASDQQRVVDAKEELEAIQKVATTKEKDVSALSELSLKFAQSREPVVDMISEYHAKLQSITPSPVSVSAIREGTTKKQSASPSIETQATNLKKKREWILDQSIAPPEPPPCFPEKVVLEGIPQGTLRVGQQYSLQADISNAGEGQVKSELSGPTQHELCRTEEARNKKVDIFFTPKEVGKHKVNILFSETPVPQSPLEFDVVDPALVSVIPPSPNKWGVFTTHEPHIYHITCPGGPEQITATAQGSQSVKEFGVPVHDLGDGKYDATVITPTSDKYDVKFYCSGHLVPSSPYVLPVEEKANADLVTCTSFVSPTDDKIGVEADTSRAGTGQLTATAQGDRAGAVECETESKGKDKWVVSFDPPMPDVYTVHVYWNDVDVPRSPFTISTIRVDASKVKVEGPYSNETPVLAVCDTSEAGEGTLTAKCTGRRFEEIPVQVTPAEQNKQNVLFTPPGKDHFTLSILWDDEHVPDSPFHINLNQPDASRVKVDGPHPCAEGIGPVHTYIDASEAGDGDLQVKCEASSEEGGPVEVTVTEEQPGHYTAVFEASNPGIFKMDVTFSNEPIPDSPFSVPVVAVVEKEEEVEEVFDMEEAPDVEASYIPEGFAELYDDEESSEQKTEALPESYPVFVPGTPLRIEVEKEDKEVHTAIKASCRGERVGKIPTKLTRNSDGDHLVSINPTRPDLYTLEIKDGKEHIPGSPFIVCYEYPPPVASKCRIHGLPSEEDKLLTREEIVYYVDATKAGSGELTVKCEGPSVSTQSSTVKITPPSESETSYKVVYIPTAPGEHKNSVLWSGEAVPDSPITFSVDQRSRPVYPWGPVTVRYTLASPVPTHISGYVVHQTSRKKLQLKVTGDPVFAGCYRCTFVPKSPGVHDVHIHCQKKPIKGSPFEVIVLGPPHVRKVVVNGLDNVRCAVDKPLKFSVDCTEAGSGDLLARSEGPSDPSRKSQLELVDNKDSTFTGTFIPTAIGFHEIYLLWGGKPVRKVPFSVEAVHGKDFELGDVELGQPMHLGVFDDPNDTLSALAIGERTGDAPITVIQDKLNRKSVLFTPFFEDDYTVSVFVNGSHVEGSPYCIRVPAAVLEPVYSKEPTPEDVVTKEEKYIFPESQTSMALQTESADEEGLGVLSFQQTKEGDQGKVCIIPEDITALSKPFEMSQPCTFRVNTFGAGPGTLEVIAQGPAEAVITIEDSDNYGVQSVQCAPTKPGEYRLEVQWNDTPLEESPLLVNFHHELVKIGVDLSVVPFYIGKPYQFKTLCKEVGEGKLTVNADPQSAATVNVRELGSDTFLTSITPTAEGNHKISVTHGEHPVYGSPFSVSFVKCGDASRCCLVEEDQPMEDGKMYFMVDTKGSGEGTLTAEVLSMPGKLDIPCDVEAVRDTTYWMCFEPKQEIPEYLVSIKYDGAHIPRSPFQLVLSDQPDASACRAEGDGLQFAEVNKESQFVVFTDCTEGDLKVTIQGESERVFPSVYQHKEGVYEFKYFPQFQGEHKIEVIYNSEHIPGSPFTVTAHPPSALPKICVDKHSIQDVVYGYPVSFDILDVPSDAALTVTAYTEHEAVTGKISVTEEGLFRGTFDPPKPGNFTVHCCWEGKEVLGSPFKVRVFEPPVPGNVKASGAGLTEGVAGRKCDFTVDTKGAGAGTLVVEVTGPNGPVPAKTKWISGEKRSVEAGFLPCRPGEYTIAVLWADTHIPGSPFKVQVRASGRDESV